MYSFPNNQISWDIFWFFYYFTLENKNFFKVIFKIAVISIPSDPELRKRIFLCQRINLIKFFQKLNFFLGKNMYEKFILTDRTRVFFLWITKLFKKIKVIFHAEKIYWLISFAVNITMLSFHGLSKSIHVLAVVTLKTLNSDQSVTLHSWRRRLRLFSSLRKSTGCSFFFIFRVFILHSLSV